MKVTSNGRVRRTAAEWSEILSRYEASGLSSRAFCRREHLSLNSLRRWQRRLDGVHKQFVELTPPSERAERTWECEVRLPNGVQLQFRG